MDHENLDHGGQVIWDGLDFVEEGRMQTQSTIYLGWNGLDVERVLKKSASSEVRD